jgi:DNA-binding NarL/FixJ family response regulator
MVEIPRPAVKPSRNIRLANDGRGESSVRVLVVDDYAEFRELVCVMLGQRQNLQVVGEASDGNEAVSKAVELRPDLILLDIDLPRMDGIEAARQIRNLIPKSKIIFLSAESSVVSLQSAMNVGAWGYVLKLNVGTELLFAIDTVLLDKRFVSMELSTETHHLKDEDVFPSLAQKNRKIARTHEAQFHSDERSFLGGFTRFIEAALSAGSPVIAVATPLHQKNLLERLEEHGVDCSAAIEQGRYIPLDVTETLSSFMVNDVPDPVRFFELAGNLLATAGNAATGKHSRVSACGEGTAILWAQGKADAAIRLEQLWDEIAKTYNTNILCGFALNCFQREQESHIYQRICAVHSAVSLH